jgi:hypothetical protein
MYDIVYLFVSVILTIWVARDCRKQQMNPLMWGTLAFLANIIGFALYLFIRHHNQDASTETNKEETTTGKTCWFCRIREASKDTTIKLYFENTKDDNPKRKSLVIPRCRLCWKAHDKADSQLGGATVIGSIVGGLTGLVITAQLNETGASCALCFVAFIVSLVLGGFLGSITVSQFHKNIYKTRPYDAWKKHKTILQLESKGWQRVMRAPEGWQHSARTEPELSREWQKNSANPYNLFCQTAPRHCPVCGTRTKVTSLSFVGMLISNMKIERSVKCIACNAWGCTACAHHHFDKQPANTYRGEQTGGGFVPYPEHAWGHDMCCPCKEETVLHNQQARWKHIIHVE